MARSRQRPTAGRRHGFALVLALSLTAFILLLLLAISTLVRVESRSAGSEKEALLAKQNALLGLWVALGDLQKTAGADRRITATAGIDSGTDPAKAHWTGVWNNTEADVLNRWGRTVAPGGRIDWLVSSQTEPDATAAGPAPGTSPDHPTLVGSGSVDLAARPSDAVVAERIPIRGRSAQVEGHFAWWVSDESTKARANLYDPFQKEPPASPEYRQRLLAPPGTGVRLLSGAWNALDTAAPELAAVSAPGDFELLDGTLGDAARERFHDLTTASQGLQTNNRDGGLKADLTRIFEDAQGPADADPLYPVAVHTARGGERVASNDSANAPTNIVGFFGSAGFGTNIADTLPTWGLLRSFYNLKNEISVNRSATSLSRSIAPRAQNRTRHGIYPVILHYGIAYALDAIPGAGELPDTDAPILILDPVIVLGNPHNVALTNATYLLSWWANPRMRFGAGPGSGPYDIFDGLLGALIGPSNPNSGYSTGQPLFFEIQTGFEPGEVKIFSYRPRASHSSSQGRSELIPTFTPGEVLSMAQGISGEVLGLPLGGLPRVSDIPSAVTTYRASFFTDPESNGGRFHEISLFLGGSPDAPGALLHSIEEASRTNRSSTDGVLGDLLLNPPISEIGSGKTAKHGYRVTRFLANYNPRHRVASGNATIQEPHSLNTAGGSEWPGSRIPNGNGNAYWGTNWQPTGSGPFQTHTPYFDVFDTRIASIGQLQHANVGERSYDPAWTIGNAWASEWVPSGTEDVAYKLNDLLWDRYFFSTIPSGLDAAAIRAWQNGSELLANPRMEITGNASAIQGALAAHNEAAAHLRVKGPFNVNSTSVAAWTAVLSPLSGLAYLRDDDADGAYTDVDDIAADEVWIPRLGLPQEPPITSTLPGGGGEDPYADSYHAGGKKLSRAQVIALATGIVDLVRREGPFTSLADFINRDLGKPAGDPLNLRGLLQVAINAAGINDEVLLTPVNDPNGNFLNKMVQSDTDGISGLPYPGAHEGSSSEGAPGFLTQADVLSLLGPALTVRGDTFVIRSYGDRVDPLGGTEQSRAVCEAVVQRTTTPVKPNPADTLNPDTSLPADFGRRFRIVSIRWLPDHEI